MLVLGEHNKFMTKKQNGPTIAIVAYKFLLHKKKTFKVEELYDAIINNKLYKFNAISRNAGIGILALSIKRHMVNSNRGDKFDCMLFKSDDGLACLRTSTVSAISSAKNYIIKLSSMLAN